MRDQGRRKNAKTSTATGIHGTWVPTAKELVLFVISVCIGVWASLSGSPHPAVAACSLTAAALVGTWFLLRSIGVRAWVKRSLLVVVCFSGTAYTFHEYHRVIQVPPSAEQIATEIKKYLPTPVGVAVVPPTPEIVLTPTSRARRRPLPPKASSGIPPTSPPATGLQEPPLVTSVRIVHERRIEAEEPELPYGLEVTLQTDRLVEPVAFAFHCSGPIGKARGFFQGYNTYQMSVQRVAGAELDWFVVEWQSPAFTPANNIIVTFFSKTDIRVIDFRRFEYAFPLPDRLRFR